MDSVPAIFVIDLQDATKLKKQNKKFLLFFEDTFTSCFKDKKSLKKKSNSRNQGFLTIFA
jgi:hypothetical protein